MRRIPESELIVNPDGTIFHLHLLPEQIADKIVMMGDPKRVDMAASLFDERICSVQNREFKSVTGRYKGTQVTAMSAKRGLWRLCAWGLRAACNGTCRRGRT